MIPGRRLRLHPDDLYALGGHRGGINERWFSSTTNADNGPNTPADEGLSYVRAGGGARFQLKHAVEAAGDALIGSDVMKRERGWNLLCKFFDNMGPIPHHMHQSDVFAMFQSEVEGRIIDWSLLTKDVPPDHHRDLDYIVGMLDWNANVNPEFAKSNRVFPRPVRPFAETVPDGYREQWVCYGTGYY